MFSSPEFLEAIQSFVAVRLETFESKEHEKLIRELMDGRFANTAFCILAPDGEERLTRTGRSPSQILGPDAPNRGRGNSSDEKIVAHMQEIAEGYQQRDSNGAPVLQDFHSFRQALNVAAGDQRLLLYAVTERHHADKLQSRIGSIFSYDKLAGIFHVDQSQGQNDEVWSKNVEGASPSPGYYLIEADEFGQDGKVIASFPLSTEADALEKSLQEANRIYGERVDRKVYSEHVEEGRRKDVFFENEVPYGEDRDGDGEIDHRRGRG